MTTIDFEKFESLSEEEQLSLKKTWGEREWCDYLEKGGYVSCEEFFEELKAAVVDVLKRRENNTDSPDAHDTFYDMAAVGCFKCADAHSSPQEFMVFVNGNEVAVPHFHIWDNDTNGQVFHTCICINEVKYFHHTGHENVLNENQKQELMAFLRKSPPNKRYKTHWEYICSMWNDNNPTLSQVDESTDAPDYRKLQDFTEKYKYTKERKP